MFTGLVEETGVVRAVKPSTDSVRLTVSAKVAGRGVHRGDSIAINGCCLTVVQASRGTAMRRLEFDLLQETWNRTNLSSVKAGQVVNLERSLAVGARLGGHFVTGHVDATGTISVWEARGKDRYLEVEAPPEVLRYVILKGSIAVDGISLTVAAVHRRSFAVWIIPHTHQVTALRERHVGDRVNLEADLLGKYVERILGARGTASRKSAK